MIGWYAAAASLALLALAGVSLAEGERRVARVWALLSLWLGGFALGNLIGWVTVRAGWVHPPLW